MINLFYGALVSGAIIGGALLAGLAIVAGILWLGDEERLDTGYFGEAVPSAIVIGFLSGIVYFLFHLANPPW